MAFGTQGRIRWDDFDLGARRFWHTLRFEGWVDGATDGRKAHGPASPRGLCSRDISTGGRGPGLERPSALGVQIISHEHAAVVRAIESAKAGLL